MKRTLTLAGVLAALLVGAASAAVELTPFRVEESRSIALAPDKVGRMADKLKVTLSLKGPEADAAAKFGKLKLTEAVDDKGTNLILKNDSFNDPEKFKEFSNQFFRKSDLEGKRPAAAPQVDIEFAKSARGATKITSLKGELTLSTAGDIKSVEVPAQKTTGSVKMDIPAEAGFAITLNFKDGDTSQIGLDFTGDEAALESLEIYDAKGTKISWGISTWSMGKTVNRSISANKPLDDTMKVIAKISLNRKLTVVPIDLKDIPLP